MVTRSCGTLQLRVIVQVAGLVTVPEGSWGGNLVFFKLSGIRVLQHLEEVGVKTRSCRNFQGLEFRWQYLMQHLEEVGAETRSSGSFQASKLRWQDLLQHLEEVGMATRSC